MAKMAKKLCKRIPLIALFILSGCASAPKEPAPEAKNSAPIASSSSVDIDYILGHNQHRIHAESDAEGAHAQEYLDKQVVDEGAIDRDHYSGFLQKASSFVEATQKTPAPAAEHATCRSPFTVIVRVGGDTKTTHGCRSIDEAGISHLVRDGEFLLSAKQN